MSNARAILGERLARGEISEDEYDRLVTKLGVTSAPETEVVTEGAPAPEISAEGAPTAPPPSPASLIQRWWKWAAAGAAIFVGISIYNSAVNNRVHVLHLRSSGFFGDYVTGALLTEGESGEVYLWVEQNNQMMCPKKTFISSRQQQRFEFSCGSLKATAGTFKVLTNRSPSDWVRKNARSL